MESLGKFTAIVGGFLVLIFLAPIIGVLGGAFCGWVVGLIGFEPVILDFLSRLGMRVDALHAWQVGAAMGFLGGFLKTNSASAGGSN